ncbi:MAG: tRNA lysidine(34) synthetase TilS [Synechococcus sp. NAT40]|nr:tRNA lysidine(34) synthetase TilS [Synechococcus sp. NAT40]
MDPQADPALSSCWSGWHDRLHRELLKQPKLLPQGAMLLLAVSGGQDSMALTALLLGLRRLHNWTLHGWHGDHSWHQGSSAIATELQRWSEDQGLRLAISRANAEQAGSEAKARDWRYDQLGRTAVEISQAHPDLPCRRVICAHTATDKAETLLLQMARGTDLAGLGSLRRERTLDSANDPKLLLVRPLLSFTRKETATICSELKLPIWNDPSNNDLRFGRNRIRQEVLPVLNAMHPGCEQRMAHLSERLSQLEDSQSALLQLSLRTLEQGPGLNRRHVAALAPGLRRMLLAQWLRDQGAPPLNHRQLDDLTSATASGEGPGGRDLGCGWRIQWDKNALQLEQKP